MKITLYLVSGSRLAYCDAARREYMKRLTRFCRIEAINIKNYETLRGHLDREDRVFLLAEGKGESGSSEEFAQWISRAEMKGIRNISVIAGEELQDSFFGRGRLFRFSDPIEVNDFDLCAAGNPMPAAPELFSISRAAFSPDLLSVLFLEQLYRAYKIKADESYHK